MVLVGVVKVEERAEGVVGMAVVVDEVEVKVVTWKWRWRRRGRETKWREGG